MVLEWDYPRPRTVASRAAPADDCARACCLGCGGDPGDSFPVWGPVHEVEERAREHTAETGHVTRMHGPQPVTEFYIP